MRRTVALAAALAVVAGGGYLVADAEDVVPGVLTTAPRPTVTSAAPTPSASPSPARPSPTSVLAALAPTAPEPSAAGLSAALAGPLGAPALGSDVSAYVADASTGKLLLERAADEPRTPASVTKLLTGTALLDTYDPSDRLVTRVVQGATPDEVVLVGGGDVLLGAGHAGAGVVGRAGLADLAAQVAARLRASGRTKVAVRVDDSLFVGPTLAPEWAPADIRLGLTGRVTALSLAGDHPTKGHPGPADPSVRAGEAFAAALRAQGVGVAGQVARFVSSPQAVELGRVSSAPVGEVLGFALATSDNQLAEVLARLVAVRLGRPGSFEDATVAVLERVQHVGINTSGTRLVDGSGLSRSNQIPAHVIGDIVRRAAGPDAGHSRELLTGLPVGGWTGTLAERFSPRGPARAGTGLLRAKTGTLTGVSSLAGTVQDADGRLLVFTFMADRTGNTLEARAALDRAAATLARCGCH